MSIIAGAIVFGSAAALLFARWRQRRQSETRSRGPLMFQYFRHG
jgi:hypothetical protein